jgi:predicted SnoaL-like aldol condensation-catalyzing enzyme
MHLDAFRSDTFRLVGGKIMEHWVGLDTLHLGRQIAAIVPLDYEDPAGE